MNQALRQSIFDSVTSALAEDIESGDITGALIDDTKLRTAQVITREDAIMCGQAWVEMAFKLVDPNVQLQWLVNDGDLVSTNQVLFTVNGMAQSLLTAERTALNFLQLLSGTATLTNKYVKQIAHTTTKLLDTRKTIVGLRLAQKYAVICGGGYNHRFGLYDAFLIKENHIVACGSITKAILTAKQMRPELAIEVEIECLEQLEEAILAGADQVLLDNFDLATIKHSVIKNHGQVKLEVSGGVDLNSILAIAETGVDYISVGAITKNIQAIDLSMRLI